MAQPACRAHDVEGNASAHARAVRTAAARVVVFCELSLAGYGLDAAPIAPGDGRLAPLVAACAEAGTFALAGVPVPGPRIGVLAVDGGGARVAYRKTRLGADGAARFVPGAGRAATDVDGWCVGMAVCRDTGVAEHAAKTAAPGVDGCVAGLVHDESEAEAHGARARRIAADHGVRGAMAVFAGPTGGGCHRASGRSGIWSSTGELLAEASTAPDDVVRADFTSTPCPPHAPPRPGPANSRAHHGRNGTTTPPGAGWHGGHGRAWSPRWLSWSMSPCT
ncbi:nitrilase-related carbon-nitrogen hydrolase [Streptomyces sp. NPDC050560]|uniref:nitrilase-related carbon-nitrogen hydrolase n=1 Tax=Streptomyces sp. NPDC050560 TaxID=3365630 RepID=UPI0037BA2355